MDPNIRAVLVIASIFFGIVAILVVGAFLCGKALKLHHRHALETILQMDGYFYYAEIAPGGRFEQHLETLRILKNWGYVEIEEFRVDGYYRPEGRRLRVTDAGRAYLKELQG